MIGQSMKRSGNIISKDFKDFFSVPNTCKSRNCHCYTSILFIIVLYMYFVLNMSYTTLTIQNINKTILVA